MNKMIYLSKKGDYHFEIVWTDGRKQVFHLSTVQTYCPCCRCVGRENSEKVEKEVRALKIEKVGSYALKILFDRGCSFGIYPFSLLREIGK